MFYLLLKRSRRVLQCLGLFLLSNCQQISATVEKYIPFGSLCLLGADYNPNSAEVPSQSFSPFGFFGVPLHIAEEVFIHEELVSGADTQAKNRFNEFIIDELKKHHSKLDLSGCTKPDRYALDLVRKGESDIYSIGVIWAWQENSVVQKYVMRRSRPPDAFSYTYRWEYIEQGDSKSSWVLPIDKMGQIEDNELEELSPNAAWSYFGSTIFVSKTGEVTRGCRQWVVIILPILAGVLFLFIQLLEHAIARSGLEEITVPLEDGKQCIG